MRSALIAAALLTACGGVDGGPDAPATSARQCAEFTASNFERIAPALTCYFDLDAETTARTNFLNGVPVVMSPAFGGGTSVSPGAPYAAFKSQANRWTEDPGRAGVVVEFDEPGTCQWVRCLVTQ